MKLSLTRRLVSALVAAAMLLGVPIVLAAPTCQDKNLITAKCGTKGAMPVGWTPSPEQILDRQWTGPAGPSTNEVLDLFCVIAVFFALIALMPEFDGSRSGGWGEQEGDDKDRKYRGANEIRSRRLSD